VSTPAKSDVSVHIGCFVSVVSRSASQGRRGHLRRHNPRGQVAVTRLIVTVREEGGATFSGLATVTLQHLTARSSHGDDYGRPDNF